MIIQDNSFHKRKLYFEGNSLMAQPFNALLPGGGYIPTSAYTTIIGANNQIAMVNYAIAGMQQVTLNGLLASRIVPYVKPNDIIFLWEGTNDMGNGGLTGAQAWANVVTYINTVIPLGIKLVIGTVMARDYVTDPADLMTRIGDYNTLVRNNASIYGYTVCDIGANAAFDTRADASVGTNYNADKIHLVGGGQDIVHPLISTSILAII